MSETDLYRPPDSLGSPPPVADTRVWPLGCSVGVLNFPVGLFFGFLASKSPFWSLVLLLMPLPLELLAGLVLLRRGQRRLGKVLLLGPFFSGAFVAIAVVLAVGFILWLAGSMEDP